MASLEFGSIAERILPPKKGIKNGRMEALRVLKIIVANADALGVEAIFDYIVKPHGRAWKCDRGAWSHYKKETIHGGGSGDWLHFEISPEMADNPAKMREVFANLVIPDLTPQDSE